jgi:hypothetical protein
VADLVDFDVAGAVGRDGVALGGRIGVQFQVDSGVAAALLQGSGA